MIFLMKAQNRPGGIHLPAGKCYALGREEEDRLIAKGAAFSVGSSPHTQWELREKSPGQLKLERQHWLQRFKEGQEVIEKLKSKDK